MFAAGVRSQFNQPSCRPIRPAPRFSLYGFRQGAFAIVSDDDAAFREVFVLIDPLLILFKSIHHVVDLMAAHPWLHPHVELGIPDLRPEVHVRPVLAFLEVEPWEGDLRKDFALDEHTAQARASAMAVLIQ